MPVPALAVPVARCVAITAAAVAVRHSRRLRQQPHGGFQMPPAQVTTVTVEPKTIPVSYEYVGQTTGSKEVEVRARVTGILEQKFFQEGAAVKQGQRLFAIDPKPLQAQAAAAEADVVRARAQKAQADREAARLKPLAERKAIGQKEADDAASNAEFASANVRAAEAKLREVQLNLGYTNVAAPITGLTSRAPKSEGSLVNANDTLLTTIWQVHPIWVPFAIPESDQLALQKEVAAGRLVLPKDNAFDVTIKLTDGTVFPRQGRINFADSRVNPSTGSVEYRAEIPNADGALKPGQFVRVKLAGAKRMNAFAVPQIAVLDGAQGKFVYVVDKDKDGKDIAAVRPSRSANGSTRPTRRTATCGSSRAASRAGDRVIVDGVAKLRPGAPIMLGGAPAHPEARRAALRHRRRTRTQRPPATRRPRSRKRRRVAMFSRFFIDRPIFAAVISLFLVLAGLAAMRTLPIAQYPEIAPPVVTVQAIYPGASADVIEKTVAAPLENAINGVPNMIYMSSSSTSNGVVQIQVTFEIGTRIDDAAVNVNNRVKQVEPRLPEEVRRQGVTVERGSSSFLQVLAFYSPDDRYNDLFISNYVTLNVLDQLKRLPGTTNVQIFGAKDYAMRIWVKPDRLAQLKLTPSDLIRAVNEQNAQFAAGKIGQSPTTKGQDLVYTITTQGRLTDAKEFGQIIVRANPDGSTVRLSDVARIELGSRDYDFIGRYNGKPATLVGIFLQPGANALASREERAHDDDRALDALPGRPHVRGPVRHHALRRGVDQGGRVHARRGDGARDSRRLHLPAELARDADPAGRGAGVAAGRVRRPVRAGLFDQHADAVRHGAGDRHRGRRRDRRAGERRADHARGERDAARGRDPGDARSDRADRRDRADADGRVRADRVPRRPDGRAVPTVRGDDFDRGRHLRPRRADADARAERADPAPASAGEARVLRAVQPLFRRASRRHYSSGVAWMIRRGIVGVILFVGMVVDHRRACGGFTPGSLVPDEDQGWFFSRR